MLFVYYRFDFLFSGSADCLNDRGNILRDMSRYDDAIDNFERGSKILHKLFGDCGLYAAVLVNLASVLQASKHHETALAYQQVALNIYRKQFGADHEQCVAVLRNMTHTLRSLDRLAEARASIEQAIRISTRIYGANHPEVAIGLSILGNIASTEEKLDEAVSLFERALAIHRVHSGDRSEGVAIALGSIAVVYAQQDRPAQALDCWRQCVIIDKALFGEVSLQVAGSLRNIGMTLADDGEFNESIVHLQRALSIYEKVQEKCFDFFFLSVVHFFFVTRFSIWMMIMSIVYKRNNYLMKSKKHNENMEIIEKIQKFE